MSSADPDLTLAAERTHDLVQLAADHYEIGESGQPYVAALKWRGTEEVLEAMRELSCSIEVRERVLAADVLGELGLPDRTFPDECAALLLEMLERESDPDVLVELAYAFGHLKHPAGIGALADLRDHDDEEVRMAVVHGLLAHEDKRAIDALIELSTDESPDVRDWATFGLGTQIETDSPEIRRALAARLQDPHKEAWEEAVTGLAYRGDPRAIEPAVAVASGAEPTLWFQEALIFLAAKTGDQRLRPALLEFEAEWRDSSAADALREALERTRQ